MVARYLKKLTEDCRLDWQNPRSPLLVGMFHDLCKMDNYQHPVIAETLGGEEIRDDSKWEYATDTLLKGHGDKSVMVLAQYFKLTEEEIMCIRYHMGLSATSPNGTIIHEQCINIQMFCGHTKPICSLPM